MKYRNRSSPIWSYPQPEISSTISTLNDWINAKEAVLENIMGYNAAKLEFYDSILQKQLYSVLYLHGFSASSGEGDPLHRKYCSCTQSQFYLPRLSDHD